MPWVKNKFGATVWVFEDEPEETKAPKSDAGTSAKPKTNKYGGPKGTKKDQYGNPLGVHKGKGDAGGRVGSDGKVVTDKALSDKVLATAASESQRRAAEAAAAAEKRRQEMLNRLNTRAKKLSRKLEGELSEIEAARQKQLDAAARVQERINSAKKGGSVQAIMELESEMSGINRELLRLEHREMRAYGKRRRSEGFDELQARIAVRNATNQYTGAALGTDANPYRYEKPEGTRAEYGFGGVVRDQYETAYRTKPGETGHAKSIRKAMVADMAMAAQHPEWFDTQEGTEAVNEGFAAHFDQLDAHAAAISEQFQQKQDRQAQLTQRFNKARARYKKSGSEKDRKRLLTVIDKYKALVQGPDYKKLVAEVDAIWGKTAIRPDFTVSKATQLGLYWMYDAGIRHVYANVEDRQNLILSDVGNAMRRRQMEKDVADLRSDIYDIYARLSPERYDPLTGQMQKQDFQSWLVKVEREGLPPEALQLEERKWEETVDVQKRAQEVESDPVLGRFYKSLAEKGIQTQEDLKYTANLAVVDKVAGLAVNAAFSEWQASKDYDPPGGKGIYDPKRYGTNAIGDYYVMDGGALLYKHVPLPKDRSGRTHPQPLWGRCSLEENGGYGAMGPSLCSIENSFEQAAGDADRLYHDAKRREFVEVMEKETGRSLRDVMAYEMPGSEVISATMGLPSTVVRFMEAGQGKRVGLEGERTERHILQDVDVAVEAKRLTDEFINSDEYVNPGEEWGLFEQSNYGVDDEGAYFDFKDPNGGKVTRIRRGQYLPVQKNPVWNGGAQVEPMWFNVTRDGAVAGMPMGMFESPEEYNARMQNMVPLADQLERDRIHYTQQFHEAYEKRALEELGGTQDFWKALEESDEFELVYRGKAADMPGGASTEPLVGKEWGPFHELSGALNHALSVVTGEEIVVIRSRKDGKFLEEKYFTIDIPVGGRVFETPFELWYEYGDPVEQEIQEDVDAAVERLRNGEIDVFLESMNEAGKPMKFGSMADAVNFLYEMAADVTNWIPFVSFGKRGLNALKAGVAAGKVPRGSATARVIASLSDASRALRTHPDRFRMAGALANDAERSIGVTSDEFTQFLENDLYDLAKDIDVNSPEGLQKLVNNMVEYFVRKDPTLNPEQLHRWVESNVIHLFRAKGIKVKMSPDAAREQLERMKASTLRKDADAVELEARVQQRAKDQARAAKEAEREARKLERERAAARAKDLERQAERQRAQTAGPEVVRGETPVRRGTPTDATPRSGQPAELLADTVEGQPKGRQRLREEPLERGGSKTVETMGDADLAAGAGKYRNRRPTLPKRRFRKRPKGFIGPMQQIGPADVRRNIDNALEKIAEAERKLRGQPSRERMAVLKEELASWQDLKTRMDAEMVELERVEQMLDDAAMRAEQGVKGVWEPIANEEGVFVLTKVAKGDYEDWDLHELTRVMQDIALEEAGYPRGWDMKEFRAYRKWLREASHEVNGNYNRLMDELSGGKLNPNLNIEKNLTIIREMEALIDFEMNYARLRMGLGAPEDLYGKWVPGTAGKVEALARVDGLADSLANMGITRRARLSEAKKQADAAPRYERHPYKLDTEYSKRYAPREPTGSSDTAIRAKEAEMVQQWRGRYGVASVERTRSQWRTGERVTFPALIAPPGSQIVKDPYLQSLDTLINGPDYQAAARAFHEKALIYEQAWNRYHAVANGTEWPNGYQSFLSGGFREPESLGRLNAQNRAIREITSRSRMNQPTDRYYMVATDAGDEVYLGHVRKVTVENDVRGRTAKEIAGEEYWFYADQGRGPGNDVLQLEGAETFATRIGDDLERAKAGGVSNTWYQPWDPWTKVAGNPALAGNPGTAWRALNEATQNLDFVKGWEAQDFEGWLRHVMDERQKMGWTELGAHDFRRGNQPLVDLFHRLHEGVVAGDAQSFETLERFHDVMSGILMGGKATDLDELASLWLLMESRMGLPFALPSDFATANFKRMARRRGMMPERAAMMVQHKLWNPKRVGHYSDLNPSIHGLFDPDAGPRIGAKRVDGPDGRPASWAAEPPEEWLATGKASRKVGDHTFKADWQDAYHLAMTQEMSFDVMVRRAIAMLRTNSALDATWALSGGGKLRAAVLERSVHEAVTRRIVVRGGKVGFRSAEDARAIGNLYWNDLMVRGAVPPGAIDYDVATRSFVLDDATVKVLGKETATLDELAAILPDGALGDAPSLDEWATRLSEHAGRHQKRGSFRIPPKVGQNPFGASKLGTGQTYSRATGAGGKAQPLREAFERGVNGVGRYKPVPSSTPFESVMHFMAERAYWTDAANRSAGIRRANFFLTEMEMFAKKGMVSADDLEMAKALVRDLLGADFRHFMYRLDEAAGTGASAGYLVRNVLKGDVVDLMERVGYSTRKEMAQKAVASAKARKAGLADETAAGAKRKADEARGGLDTEGEEALRKEMGKDTAEDNGWLDLGTEGALPGRVDELEGRWERLFEGEGGKVLPEASEVVRDGMRTWDKANPQPPRVPRHKRRRVESVEETPKGVLSSQAKVGDEVTLPMGAGVIKGFEGDMVLVEIGGETRKFLRSSQVWRTKQRRVKFEDIKGTPEAEKVRDEAIKRRERWETARAAEEDRLVKAARDLRTGTTSVEAESLVREVVDLLTTPGHEGAGHLRIAKIAADMARSNRLAEALREDIIDAFRTIPPIYDGGVAVFRGGDLVKVADEAKRGPFPKMPERPKTVEERYAGKEGGPVREPDEVGPTREQLRKDYEKEMEAYDKRVAEVQAETNRIIEERAAALPNEPEGMLGEEFALGLGNDVRARYLKPVLEHDGLSARVQSNATPEEFTEAVGHARRRLGWDEMPTDADVEAATKARFGDEATDEQFHAVRNEMVAEVKAQNASVIDTAVQRLEDKVGRRLEAEGESLPLPDEPNPEQWADAGDEGVRIEVDPRDAAHDVHAGAKMAWEVLGMSEERYYQRLIRANREEMVRKGTSKARYEELGKHNDNLVLALRAVRRQKKKGTYVKPTKKMQDAFEGATKVRDEIEGVIPEQKMGYLGETEEAIELEHARNLRARAERARRAGRVQGRGLPPKVLQRFDVRHWRGLTDAVAEAVRGVQPQRSASLNLGRRTDPNDIVDDVLRTNRDRDPVVREAVKRAIREYCEKEGIPQWNIELYWRVRTLVRGSEGRMRRGIGMLETAGPDMDALLNLRRAAADREAFEHVKWWLYNNPQATPEEAAEYFRLTAGNSGVISDMPETLTEADLFILDEFVKHYTGVDDVTDNLAMREALGKHGKPPLDNRLDMRRHQERVGRWSPRTTDEVITKGAWSMDDEIEYWSLYYEDVPRWLDDPRIRSGEAFDDYDVYQAVMKETGGFDDAARLHVAKMGDRTFDPKEFARGKMNPDGTWEIKPKKDWEVQRRYAIERYGDRVATNGKFHSMPWLMTPDELVEYVGKHGEVKGIISSPAEIRAANTAIQEVVGRHIDEWVAAYKGDITTLTLTSGDIHEMTYELVQQLVSTTPWRKALKNPKQALHGAPRGAMDAWAAFWTGLVTINPAFVISNTVDVPTKAVAFSFSEKYAKRSVSQRAIDAIPDASAVNHGNKSSFYYSRSARDWQDRVRSPWDRRDFVGGAWDALSGWGRPWLMKVENKSKTMLARQLYTGLWDEFADDFLNGVKSMANPNGLKVTEEQVDLLIKLRVRDRLNDLFPSLADAGKGERLLNQLLPFISYNAKNRLLWTSWVLDHPWSIRLLQEAQGQLVAHNEREWAKEHGDAPMPENLSHQIPLPGGFFLDIGMFTDAARGAEWVTTGMKTVDGYFVLTTTDIEEFVRLWVRPLPSQEAFVRNLLYDVTDAATGHGWGGRYVWRKVLDENGFWDSTGGPNGDGYIQDYVGPGTPWGDRDFNYMFDLLPMQGLVETLGAVASGDLDVDAMLAVRILGNIMDFQEFGHVSETYGLYLVYRELLGPDEENPNYAAAQHWLQNTEDGQRLTQLWAQQYYDPDIPDTPFGTEAKLNNYADLFYDAEGNFVAPSAKEMRQRWLQQQPPEMAALIREANQKFFALRDQLDQMLDQLDPWDTEGRQHLWKLRRSLEGALSQEYPEVYAYYAFGQSPEEAAKYRMQSAIDTQRQQFYDMFGWEHAPERGTPEFEQWEKRKRLYLEQHPEFAATLADEYSQWQASLNRVERIRDKAVANMASAEKVREWARDNGREGLANAAQELIDFNAKAFGMEAAGYDEKGEFKFRHDSGWRKYLRGDDPAKVWYADAMRGVGQRAVDENGDFDTEKWWRIIDRNPELRAEYLEREGLSTADWNAKGELWSFHSQWAKAADAGQWDKAWRLYEKLSDAAKDAWEAANPKGFRERLRSYEYQNAMGRWVAYFDRGDIAGGMRFFESLPKWMRDRYYENNPGKRLSQGQNAGYVSMLNDMFDQIDAGNWDAAERIWNSAPAWMRSQYYANNPDSTLFRGGGKGGGISDAKFKQYTRAMKGWVELLKDGKEEQAQRYFDRLPQWMKDFYFQNNPDKKWQMQEDRMLALAAEYFVADKAARAAMLKRNPGLRRWLNENDVQGARADAIRAAYEELPDDPWLRRVYKEKYPEVFSAETTGERYREEVFDIINEHSFIAEEWMRQYKEIVRSMEEALKYMHPRPRQLEQDYSAMRVQMPMRGLSAAETAKRAETLALRTPVYTRRTPRAS